jgi:ribosomal-protein-alanine N-acetyltransferase
MEVKFRVSQSSLIPGGESWTKEKLGKSSLLTYRSEIEQLLRSLKLPPDPELFERNSTCNVHKERYSGCIQGISYEITYLRLQFSDSENNRNWLSICFEDSESTLSHFLKSSESRPLIHKILASIQLIFTIISSQYSISSSRRFFPILSGYPAWLHSLVSPAHAISAPILNPLHSLFRLFQQELSISFNLPIEGSAISSPETFDWMSFPTLQTPRLTLQNITRDHVEDVFQIRNNYQVTHYNIGPPYSSLQQASDLVDSMILDFQQKKSLRWGITLNSNNRRNQVIGMIGYNYWSTTDHRGSIGFDMNELFWGNGYMTESVNAVLKFGFEKMHLNRVEALVSAENKKSLDLLQKIGFQTEGVQREQYYEEGTYHDLVMLAILKKEWIRSPASL